MSRTWIVIDGSLGEGGGQILRTSLALSILTRRPIRIQNIRARRLKPGLQAQHLMSVRAAAQISSAQVQGDELGSQNLTFSPGPVQSGDYHFRIGTAGATALVLHTVYLPLLLLGNQPSSLRIEGGTHALAAPSAEFLTFTWANYLHHLGLKIDVTVQRPGFFPKGDGILQVKLEPDQAPRPLQAIEPLDGSTDAWEFIAVLGGGLKATIAERMIHQVQNRLGTLGAVAVQDYPHAKSPGVVATLIDKRGPIPTVFSALGEKGKPAEKVANEAVESLLAHRRTKAQVDPHSADQLVLPLAFAPGPSAFTTSEVTGHLLTNLEVIGRFMDKQFQCEGQIGQPGLVKIT